TLLPATGEPTDWMLHLIPDRSNVGWQNVKRPVLDFASHFYESDPQLCCATPVPSASLPFRLSIVHSIQILHAIRQVNQLSGHLLKMLFLCLLSDKMGRFIVETVN